MKINVEKRLHELAQWHRNEARESAGCTAEIWIDKKDSTRAKAYIAAKRDEWKRQKADILQVFPPLILKQ